MKAKTIVFSVIILLALTLSVSLVSAAVSDPGTSIGTLISKLFTWIGQIFSQIAHLKGDSLDGFLRFLLWLTAFMIFFGAGKIVFGKMYSGENQTGAVNKNAGILAAVIATVTIIFIPTALLATIWESYAVIVIFLFLLIPIAGVLGLIYPGVKSITDNERFIAIIRIIGLLLIWYILAKVSQYGDKITGTVSFRTMIPLSAFYIWNKYFNKDKKE